MLKEGNNNFYDLAFFTCTYVVDKHTYLVAKL